jgi:hypothetical protein
MPGPPSVIRIGTYACQQHDLPGGGKQVSNRRIVIRIMDCTNPAFFGAVPTFIKFGATSLGDRIAHLAYCRRQRAIRSPRLRLTKKLA